MITDYTVKSLQVELVTEIIKNVQITDEEAEDGIIHACVKVKLKNPKTLIHIDLLVNNQFDLVQGSIYVDNNGNRYYALTMFVLRGMDITIEHGKSYKLPSKIVVFANAFAESSSR